MLGSVSTHTGHLHADTPTFPAESTVMNRTALRVVTGMCALVFAALSAVGPATADDRVVEPRPADARAWGLSAALVENAPLVTAIAQARADFRMSALAARTAWRTAMLGIRDEVLAEAASARTGSRMDYRDLLQQAWDRHRDQVDTATAAAKSSLLTARGVHTAAVTAAFAQHAPGASLPRAVLEPGWWAPMGDGTWLAR